jgi:hypothetical protein
MIGLNMYSKPSLKENIFEWKIDEKLGFITVKVDALLESKALRSGDAPMIQNIGSKADLRLSGFNFKDGRYSGFEAPVKGQGEEDFKNWLKNEKWILK